MFLLPHYMLPCHPLWESLRFVWVSFLAPEGLSSVLTWKLGNTLHSCMQVKCELCQRVVVVWFGR
jgi:hypothetical protein